MPEKNNFKKYSIKQIIIELLKLLSAALCVYVLLHALEFFHKKTLTIDMYMIQRDKDILYSSIATIGISIYLYFTKKFKLNSFVYMFLLSLGYGLSAYAISSNHYAETMLFLTLLPIIFLSVEYIEKHKYYMLFVTLFAIALGIDTVDSCILFIYISIYFILLSSSDFSQRLVDYLHMLLCFTLSFVLSLAFAIPQLVAFARENTDIAYPGFYINYDLATLISRFLLGSAPSDYFSDGRGLDLYFGMFFFITVILFFFNKEFERKLKIKEAIFLIIMLLTFQLSPLMHLIELCQNTESYVLYYTGFFTFYCIRLSALSISKLHEFSKKEMLLGTSAAIACILFALCGSSHNFKTLTIETIICFLVLYTLGLIAPLLSKNASTQKLLPIFIFIELVINLLVFTNQTLVPASLSPYDTFSSLFSSKNTNALPLISDAEQTDKDYEEFTKFYEDYYAADMTDTLAYIANHIEITDEDKLKYGKYGSLNSLEAFNIRAHLLGVDEDVFKEADVHFIFDDSDTYTVIDEGNNIFCLEQMKKTLDKSYVIVPFSYENTKNEHFLITCSFFDYLIEDNGSQDTFNGMLNFVSSKNLSFRFKMSAYSIDEDALAKVSGALFTDADPTQQKKENSNLYRYLILLIISACGVILFLHLTIDKGKAKTIERLNRIKEQLVHAVILQKIRNFCILNCVYIIAFLVPCISFIFAMIYYNSAPFGSGSFLDSDGISSVLAANLNYYYNLKNGNYYLSTLGGFANAMYPGLYIVFYLPMLLFSATALPSLFMLLDAILMGASGFAVCFYLTHRLNGSKADKSDWKLLIPAMIYGLNNYMIAMHSYIFWWYLLFALLPILILLQERMIYQKSWLPYSLLLFFCILTNFNIAYYICIFLAIHFFTCKFDSIKDFFIKGLWFAIPSILGAFCNYSNLYGLFASLFSHREGTGYAVADSVSPTFGLFTSYWNQWKQFMIFSNAQPITSNNGHINIYMGILFLILFVAFFASGKISLKSKLSYAIPMIILFISFNEKITTYVFNGFHYQVGVPNRHAFLFAFLGACMAYEILNVIQSIRIKSFALYSAIVIGFLCACQFFSEGNTNKAFIASLILVILYFSIITLCKKIHPLEKYMISIVNTLVIVEMFINLISACGTISIDNLKIFGDYELQANAHNEIMNMDNENYYRFSQPVSYGCNNGFLTNAPSITYFNSFLSNTLQYCSYYYGLYYGNNFVITHHNSTPLALALSSSKYIEAPFFSTASVKDLYNYDLYAIVNKHFIFKNNDALSLGIYVPGEIEYLPENALDDAASFQNYLAQIVTNSKQDILTNKTNLEIINDIKFNDSNKTDYIRFKTHEGQYVTLDEAIDIIYGADNSGDPVFTSHHLYCEITVTPKANGPLYLYANELLALGDGVKGEKITIDTPFPNKTLSDEISLQYYTFDTSQYKKFISAAKSNQLENVQLKDNVLTADIDYDQAGYTMFSLPFSGAWKIYIDGQLIEADNLMDAYLFVKTPAGKHELKMIFDLSDSIKGTYISIAIIIILCIIYLFQRLLFKEKHNN